MRYENNAMENKIKIAGGYGSQYSSPKKSNTIEEYIEDCPKNKTILDNLIRAWSIINNPKYKKILCSISGGSDSDIMLDIVWRCDKDNKVDYVWFDTGLEYQATKEHLKYLEEKYNIKFISKKAIKPIPISCREHGEPFISKNVSEFIQRLQRHNFQWEDESYDALIKKYPNCQSALEWWCNKKGENSQFNIKNKKWLKEFMIENPPDFKISNKCCTYAKKKVSAGILRENKYDLNIIGVRKSEGGARRTAYKNCFDDNESDTDNYRPIFWYTNQDKRDYENAYGIIHSKCYTEYGLQRTGCSGCQYGMKFEQELEIIEEYEPKLYKAVCNIFKKSYEYRRAYEKFKKEMNLKENSKM